MPLNTVVADIPVARTHSRLTATTMRQRLRPRPQPTLALIELASQRPVALPDRTLIDHPPELLHNPHTSSHIIY